MKIKLGKPVDIARFKASSFRIDSLMSLKREYERLSRYIRRSPRTERLSRCEICDCGRRKKIATVHRIDYLQCARCGHVYAALRLSPKGLERYYRKNRHYAARSYANPETYLYRLKHVATPKVSFVMPFVRTRRRRWLDVGSGVGDVVAAAARNGFQARGLEINEESIRFGKKLLGVELVNDDLEGLLKKEGPGAYDVVSFFGVIEHMPDPRSRVRAAKQLLSKNGLLVIEVPNAESVSTMSDFLYPGQVVRNMLPSHHISVYTQKSLERLVAQHGFKPVALWYLGLDFYNWLLHLAMDNPNFLSSPLCRFLIENNNAFQKVIDDRRMSDGMILVARRSNGKHP